MLEGPRSIGIAIYDPQQTCSIAAALNKAWELFWDGPHGFVGLNTRLVPSRDSKPAAMILADFFFLKLMSRLQAMGTVAALDFDEYGKVPYRPAHSPLNCQGTRELW